MNYFPTAELNDITKKKYNTHIQRWLDFGVPSLDTLIKDSKNALEVLHKQTTIKQSAHVHHGYYSSIVAYLQHEAPAAMKEYKNIWKAIQTENYKPISEHYITQEPTERQKVTQIDWADVIRVRDSLSNSVEKLLLAFYSYIEPVRADYYATALLKPGEPVPATENYIILGAEYKLVIQNFKTSKTYKTIEHVLPEPLKELLNESLRIEPRPFLFIKRRLSDKDPIQPMTPNEFSSWANRALSRTFNRPTNLTALRHSFVETIDYNRPIQELRKITDAMGHSISMSMGYKLRK